MGVGVYRVLVSWSEWRSSAVEVAVVEGPMLVVAQTVLGPWDEAA